MRPGGARRAPVRIPAVVGQGQAVPAVVDMAAARQRARDRAAGALDTAGDFVQRTRKPGDRS